MSAVIDPPPEVLPENITLVFMNMQVYTLLFRYVYLFFNWRFLVFLCFCLFHERETPIVHSFLIWVTLLSSFPSVQTRIWWLAYNLKTARDLINKWALHLIKFRHLKATAQEGGGTIRHWQPSSILNRRLEEFKLKNKLTNWFLLNNKFRPQLWSGPRDLHVEN